VKHLRNFLLVAFFVVLFVVDKIADVVGDFGLHTVISHIITPLFIGYAEDCSEYYCPFAHSLSSLLILFLVGVLAYTLVESERRWIWTGVAAAETAVPLFTFMSAIPLLVRAAMIGAVSTGGLAAGIVRRHVLRRHR
jgi:hypothetical protein